MHVVVHIHVNSTRPVSIEELAEHTIFVPVLADFRQTAVNGIQIHREIHNCVLRPRIPIVFGHHHKRVREVVEDRKGHRVATRVNRIGVTTESQESR